MYSVLSLDEFLWPPLGTIKVKEGGKGTRREERTQALPCVAESVGEVSPERGTSRIQD